MCSAGLTSQVVVRGAGQPVWGGLGADLKFRPVQISNIYLIVR